jgi:hypothetical protein
MADRGSAPCDGIVGDPAVTALIDSRGKLINAQVGEKLRAEKDNMAKRTKHPRTPKPQSRKNVPIKTSFHNCGPHNINSSAK